MDPIRHGHFKIKIGVSGAAEMLHLPPRVHEIALSVGREIALSGAALITGATTGFPFWAAKGAKEAGGISIGFSPAHTEREHTDLYRLPLDYMDIIVYTGFGYPGRDLFLTRATDAMIIGPGRVGTYHEFTIAYEDGKPLGILQSPDWETDDIIKHILESSHRDKSSIIYESDPKVLIEKLTVMVNEVKVLNPYRRMLPPNSIASDADNKELL